MIIDISHRNEILHSSEDNGEFLATNSHRYPFNHANTLAVVQGRSPLRKNEIQSSRTHRIFHSRFTSVCEVKLHRRGEGSGSLLSTCIMKSFVNQCQRTKFRPFVIYQKRQSAKVSFPPRSETLSLRVASRLSRHVWFTFHEADNLMEQVRRKGGIRCTAALNLQPFIYGEKPKFNPDQRSFTLGLRKVEGVEEWRSG